MKSVCLIIGAGAGIGGHVGKRFAREGYHVVLCRRSDADGLETLVKEIEGDSGSAEGRLLNIVDDNAIDAAALPQSITTLIGFTMFILFKIIEK